MRAVLCCLALLAGAALAQDGEPQRRGLLWVRLPDAQGAPAVMSVIDEQALLAFEEVPAEGLVIVQHAPSLTPAAALTRLRRGEGLALTRLDSVGARADLPGSGGALADAVIVRVRRRDPAAPRRVVVEAAALGPDGRAAPDGFATLELALPRGAMRDTILTDPHRLTVHVKVPDDAAPDVTATVRLTFRNGRAPVSLETPLLLP